MPTLIYGFERFKKDQNRFGNSHFPKLDTNFSLVFMNFDLVFISMRIHVIRDKTKQLLVVFIISMASLR